MIINNSIKCFFCEIYALKKNVIIYETKEIFAIKDISPQAPIHILFIPKLHIQSINEINEQNIYVINNIFLSIKIFMKQLGISDYRIVNNNGKYAGQSIKHIHFHVLANRKFNWPPG